MSSSPSPVVGQRPSSSSGEDSQQQERIAALPQSSTPATASGRSSNANRVPFYVYSRVDNKRYKVLVNESELGTLSVERIKRQLAKATKIPIEEQVLIYNESALINSMIGADFGLSKDVTLVLLSRPKPLQLDSQSPTSPISDNNERGHSRITSPFAQRRKQFDRSDNGEKEKVGREENEGDSKETGHEGSSYPSIRTKLSSHAYLQRNSERRRANSALLRRPTEEERSLSPLVRRGSPLGMFSSSSPLIRDPKDWNLDSGTKFTWHSSSTGDEDEPDPEQLGYKNRDALRRYIEENVESRLEEERLRWNRIWAAEKKEILQRANRDRQELMEENSRLRKEMSLRYATIDNKQLEDKRDALVKRINKLDLEKQELKNKLAHLQNLYESEKGKNNMEETELIEQYKQNLAALQQRNEMLLERIEQLELEIEQLRENEAQNVSLQEEALVQQIQEAREEEIDKWEKEKQRLTKKWKEETELLTYLSQEAKENWLKEKEEIIERFERERSIHKAEEARRTDELNQEIGALKSEISQFNSKYSDMEQEQEALKKKLSEYFVLVESSDKAFEELKSHLASLASGELNLVNQLADTVRQKAALERRVERHVQENTLLRERLLEETKKRRLLHNAMEDAKGNIRVIVRMRPLLDGETPSDVSGVGKVECRDENVITVTTASNGMKPFEFFHVFSIMSTQAEVFDEIRPLIQSAIDGYNVCIMAYGQTGTGKTFTIYGELDTNLKGVLPRAVEELFVQLKNGNFISRTVDNLDKPLHDLNSYEVKCSMVELYLDNLIDLLSEDNGASSKAKSKLEIRQGRDGNMIVHGLTEHRVHSHEELMDLLLRGNSARKVHKTGVNDRSSRSHTIFTIRLQIRSTVGNKTKVVNSKLIFVDLAGSERVSRSQSQGDRFKEAQHINKSLSSLGDVISALSLRKSHVPYRNSKLTMMLQDCLGGNAKTVMFANISPGMDCVMESVSTLQFASRVRRVQNKAIKNFSGRK